MDSNPFKTIVQGEDGVFRWGYELNIVTNPVILLMFVKYIVIFAAAIFAFNAISSWGMYHFEEHLIENAKITLLIALAFIVFVWVVMAIYQFSVLGGRYRVVFEMDDKGIVHRQIDRQFAKAQKVSLAGFVIGLAAGSPGTAGANLLAATKSKSCSDFSRVTSVKPKRWLHTIKVNQALEKNQVYVEDEDFEAVLEYIVARCPRLSSDPK